MKVQHAIGNLAGINLTPVTPGTILFAKDVGKIFLDTATERIEINGAQIAELANAIAVLNGDANVTGSVTNTANAAAALKVAEIVDNADASFDTLKEIADWISSDQTGAAARITSLETDVGTLKTAVDTLEDADFGSQIDLVDEKFADYTTTTQLEADYAKKTDLNGLASTSDLEGYATTAALQSVSDALAALTGRVAALENPSTTPTEPEDNTGE